MPTATHPTATEPNDVVAATAAGPAAKPIDERLKEMQERAAKAKRERLQAARATYRRAVRKAIQRQEFSDAEAEQMQQAMADLAVDIEAFRADMNTLIQVESKLRNVPFDEAGFRKWRAERQQRVCRFSDAAKEAAEAAREADRAHKAEQVTVHVRDLSASSARQELKKNPRLFEAADGSVLNPADVGVDSPSAKSSKRRSS